MKVIYVLDKDNGVLFNHRRQSKDAFLVENIVSKVKQENGTLYVSDYSKELFEGTDISIQSLAEFNLSGAKENDFVFIENEDIQLDDYKGKVDFYLYKWTRVYPSDKKLDLPFKMANLILINCITFGLISLYFSKDKIYTINLKNYQKIL